MPEVSVVLPFRNADETLDECLDSIERQSLDAFELIAVDDGSSDRSADRVRRRAERDGRIRLVRSEPRGLVHALNLGIVKARSSLVARMDADDRMHPDRLRLQSEFLRSRGDIVLVASQVRLFPSEQIRNGYVEYICWQNACIDPDDIAAHIYLESPFAHPSVMVRRSVLEAMGGYREGPFPEDYDLWLRMHQRGYRMAKLPCPLLDWRERPDRLSRTDPRYSRGAFDRLRASYLARDPRLGTGRGFVIWGAGRRTRQRARHLLDRGVVPEAWIDVDPRKIGNVVWDIPVRPADSLRNNRSRPFVLIYVTRHGARDEVAGRLEGWGYEQARDYLPVG
jgi:glycosyltransferase involved in cell wall biosynthesis